MQQNRENNPKQQQQQQQAHHVNQSSRVHHPPHHQHFDNHLRQDFDDDLNMDAASEQAKHNNNNNNNSGQGAAVAAATSPHLPQKDFRILRCFCGCSQLTYEQIESYAMMNVNGIIHNDEANKLLKTFLQIGHRSDKSNALLLLECYELCERISGDLDAYRDHLDDLFELCPSFLWEQKINDACEADTPDRIQRLLNEVLTALKKECVGNIECDQDFTRFRRELLRKIGKWWWWCEQQEEAEEENQK